MQRLILSQGGELVNRRFVLASAGKLFKF